MFRDSFIPSRHNNGKRKRLEAKRNTSSIMKGNFSPLDLKVERLIPFDKEKNTKNKNNTCGDEQRIATVASSSSSSCLFTCGEPIVYPLVSGERRMHSSFWMAHDSTDVHGFYFKIMEEEGEDDLEVLSPICKFSPSTVPMTALASSSRTIGGNGEEQILGTGHQDGTILLWRVPHNPSSSPLQEDPLHNVFKKRNTTMEKTEKVSNPPQQQVELEQHIHANFTAKTFLHQLFDKDTTSRAAVRQLALFPGDARHILAACDDGICTLLQCRDAVTTVIFASSSESSPENSTEDADSNSFTCCAFLHREDPSLMAFGKANGQIRLLDVRQDSRSAHDMVLNTPFDVTSFRSASSLAPQAVYSVGGSGFHLAAVYQNGDAAVFDCRQLSKTGEIRRSIVSDLFDDEGENNTKGKGCHGDVPKKKLKLRLSTSSTPSPASRFVSGPFGEYLVIAKGSEIVVTPLLELCRGCPLVQRHVVQGVCHSLFYAEESNTIYYL